MKFWKWLKRTWYSLTRESVVETPPVIEVEPELPKQIELPQEDAGEIADFKFVDSSHHHPDFDVKAYTAPLLSNKCTQGNSFKDRTHTERKRLCQENDIAYSGYHFYECKIDPIEQARFYVSTHGSFTHAPQVDFETYKTKTSEQTEADLFADKEDLLLCLNEIEKLTGFIPWLYVNYGAAGRLKFDKRFAKYPVWFARYNSFLGDIPLPWTTENVAAWQYTEKGVFAGFKGGNDVNIYYGKVNALNLKTPKSFTAF